MSTVIIGNGGAAMETIAALRSGGYTQDIHLFSDSVFPAFNPTLLTYYIAGKIGMEGLFVHGGDYYQKHGVKLHMGSKVVKLDALNKTVENAAGVKIHYDSCVVCTGASPIIPSDYETEEVYTIRTIENATALKKLIAPGKKALVAGASLIGVKVVEALVEQDVEVSLTDTQAHVFPLSAHPNCAAVIERKLEENGVHLYLGLNKPDLSPYDFVIMCAGVRPNIDFVDKEQVDTEKGILVDGFMRANCDGLYAAGDCAQVRDGAAGRAATGLWAGARYMGRAAGSGIAGKNEAFCGIIPQNNTRFLGLDFVSIGEISGSGDVFEMELDGKYCRIIWERGRIAGLNLLNMPDISGILKSRMLNSTGLSNMAMGKIFNRYPPVKEAFLERGA